MSQHFDANKETKLIENQCAQILSTGDRGTLTALQHELGVLFSNPKEFQAVQRQIAADNAAHDLPRGLTRVAFKEEHGKEYLEFSDAQWASG